MWTSASPRCAATVSVSSVADITRSRRSGRKARRTSSDIANPKSHCMERSWNSSNTISPTSEISGSRSRRWARSPSVTISRRVRADTLRSSRTEYPTVPPTDSPSLADMYAAAERAARRRGSSMRIFFPPSQRSSRRAGGTQVVFPLPGGARSTTSRFAANEDLIGPMALSTGNGSTSPIRCVSRACPRP